jgi:AcrR family transcriptional regulator
MRNKTLSKETLIVDSAIKILSVQNYQSMTTSMIARTAGIAEGTIYCYFKSKKELFIKVIRQLSDRLSELLIGRTEERKTLKENLRILGENFFYMKEETSVLYKIIYKAFSEVEDDDIRIELGTVYSKGLEKIKQIIFWNKKGPASSLSDSRIETVLMILWGIGDMIWKRHVISDHPDTGTSGASAIVGSNAIDLDSIIDFVCEWIEKN